MSRRYRDPKLGKFHRVDLSKSIISSTMISDAAIAGLVQFLNEAEARADNNRIVQILQQMLELEKAEEPRWGETKEESKFCSGPNAHSMMVTRRGMGVINPLLRKISPEKYKRQRKIEELKFSLSSKLARHTFFPHAWRAGDQWIVYWQMPSRARLRGGVLDLDDASALQMILDLARGGYLNRLRRCSRCNRWLYAKFRHQSFCSTNCQQKYYTHSAEWRKKRREYMRRYRQHMMER